MRFYTIDEILTLSSYFNEVLLKYDDFKNVVLSSPLTSKDLCSRKVMKFSEFKEKYKLNYIGYYDDYQKIHGDGESVRPDSELVDKNEIESDLRYPIIILCNDNEKNDNVPEMIHFTELVYTLEHFDDDSLEVIVIDKMIKPISKELLDAVAKYYNVNTYSVSLYN